MQVTLRPSVKEGFACSFRLRLGKWEITTKEDYYGRAFGFVLLRWTGHCGHPVWQFSFRKYRPWPDRRAEIATQDSWPDEIDV